MNSKTEKPLDNILENGGLTAIFRTICCIGDSLSSGEFESQKEDGSHGYHDMYEYSWGQFMARMCGSKVYNFSRGGMTAEWYCETFAEENGFWDNKYASQCYIIALGVNELICKKEETGTIDDIDFSDWRNNKKNFAGYYGQIIQRIKEIQPRAKIFLVSMPRECDNDEYKEVRKACSYLLNDMAEKFDNTYVIDLFKYALIYDNEFKRNYFLLGHMNPMGYYLTAQMISSYIDYIIRHNMSDFKEIGFIGTNLHG